MNGMRDEKAKRSNLSRQEVRRRQIAARRRKIQRRRNIAKIVVFVLAIIITVKLIGIIYKPSEKETRVNVTTQNAEQKKEKETEIPEYKVDTPVKRNREESLKIIKKLAKKDEIISDIYENRDDYPDEYLSAIANNPEMAEFIKGCVMGSNSESGSISKEEKKQEYPLFVQWDKRWGYVSYGDSNIGIAGCGPTCLAMVIYSLTRNDEVTPDIVADYSERNGYYVTGAGTAWSFMVDGAQNFGISAHEVSLSESAMKREIDNGNMMICAVSAGDFTTEGHFIVVYGYNEDGFFVNDPNCKYRSSRTWSYEQLENQIKNMWAYSEE